MTKPLVFLSFSARDATLAAKVEKSLEKLGLAAFNPTNDIAAGRDWRKSVQAAIRKSDAVLLLLSSPDFVDSSWMLYEAGIADALGKRVLTLVPDRFSLTQLPADLNVRHVMRWDPNFPEQAAQHVADTLAAA